MIPTKPKQEIVKVALAQGVPETCITAAVGNFVAVPILDARDRTGPYAKAWGGKMPFFRIGGGRNHLVYKDVFEWAQTSIKNSTAKTLFVEDELEMDSGIDVHLARGRNNGRLLVAYGLSYSVHDLPEWLTKGQIAPIDNANSIDFVARFVGPEQI